MIVLELAVVVYLGLVAWNFLAHLIHWRLIDRFDKKDLEDMTQREKELIDDISQSLKVMDFNPITILTLEGFVSTNVALFNHFCEWLGFEYPSAIYGFYLCASVKDFYEAEVAKSRPYAQLLMERNEEEYHKAMKRYPKSSKAILRLIRLGL